VRLIRIFALAALATLIAMAFSSATSAMAEKTVLCSADENPCKAIRVITHVHETSVSKAKLLTSGINVECDVLFLGDAVTGTEAPLVIEGNFTYTNCGSCTVTEENGPAEIAISKEGHETASVTGEGLVHVNCSGFVNCNYTGSGLEATAKGSLLSSQKNGEVSISKQAVTKEGGFLCPKTATLDITTTPLIATYIASEQLPGTGHAWEWSIGGEALQELEPPTEEVKSSGGPLVIKSPALGIEVKCESLKTEGTLKVGASIEATLQMSSCKTVKPAACTSSESLTAKVIGEIAERNSAQYLVFASTSGPWATITFTGKECSLPEKLQLSGYIAAKAEVGESVEDPFVFSEASSNGAEAKATLGESAAFFSGTVLETLGGSHKGEALGPLTGTLSPTNPLNFTGQPITTRKAVNAENVGWSLSYITLNKQWIEQGGIVNENNFTIVPIVAPAPICNFPFQNEDPFETLYGNGAKCNFGIEFKSGAAGQNATYVLEYGPYILWASQYKFTIVS
jgi:hypothetical protein